MTRLPGSGRKGQTQRSGECLGDPHRGVATIKLEPGSIVSLRFACMAFGGRLLISGSSCIISVHGLARLPPALSFPPDR